MSRKHNKRHRRDRQKQKSQRNRVRTRCKAAAGQMLSSLRYFVRIAPKQTLNPLFGGSLPRWRSTLEQAEVLSKSRDVPRRLRDKLAQQLERAEEELNILEAVDRLAKDDSPRRVYPDPASAKSKRAPNLIIDEAREFDNNGDAQKLLAQIEQHLHTGGQVVVASTPYSMGTTKPWGLR